MAKRQQRIKNKDLLSTRGLWLQQQLSVVLQQGMVRFVKVLALQKDALLCQDAQGLQHIFSLADIKEIILDIPVAAHAQKSAD